jgi:glycosyltransferase involved in cell wall biosynthesis
MYSEDISVVLPVRNGQDHIKQSVHSLLAQSLPPREIIVVDDGSEDATPQLLHSIERQRPSVRVIRTEPSGLTATLNLGLREASSTWIARADADDDYPLNRLEAQARQLPTAPVLVAGDFEVVGADNQSLGTIRNALFSTAIKVSLLHAIRIPHPGVIFSRQAALEAGGYLKEEFPAEDIGLWLRLAKLGPFVGVDEVVVRYRLHPRSVTQNRLQEQRSHTVALVERYGLPPGLGHKAIDELPQTLAAYDEHSAADVRRLLHLRDCLRAPAAQAKPQVMKALAPMLLRHPWRVGSESWKARSESQQRRSYRGGLM